jgi:hypothetical protein
LWQDERTADKMGKKKERESKKVRIVYLINSSLLCLRLDCEEYIKNRDEIPPQTTNMVFIILGGSALVVAVLGRQVH